MIDHNFEIILNVFPSEDTFTRPLLSPNEDTVHIGVGCAWCKDIYAIRALDQNGFPEETTIILMRESLIRALKIPVDQTSTICPECLDLVSQRAANRKLND